MEDWVMEVNIQPLNFIKYFNEIINLNQTFIFLDFQKLPAPNFKHPASHPI